MGLGVEKQIATGEKREYIGCENLSLQRSLQQPRAASLYFT